MTNFNEILQEMKLHGMKTPPKALRIQIPNAEKWLKSAMDYFVKKERKQLVWLSPYNEVADWLTDSKGKGLLLYGDVGQGKTMLSRYAIPAILLKVFRKIVSVYDVNEMNAKLDEVKGKRIISLDDIGTDTTLNDFGNKREAFAEIMDNAEKTGQIVIISTNLGKDELIHRYGDRVFDRIIATTRRVEFKGQSLRG